MTELKKRYIEAIKKWQRNNPEIDYLQIWKKHNHAEWVEEATIDQTLWCCDNACYTTNGVLIMGINPSFNGNKEEKDNSFFNTYNTNHSAYWSTKKNMVEGLDNSEVAYLDLFPIRMTRQTDFMSDKIIPISLKVALLEVTISEIERFAPKLIINPNMGSRVYWGIKTETPWMGYDMEAIENPIGKQTHLYRIKGVLDSESVILPRITKLREKTLFLLAKYHGNGALKADDFLSIEDIRKVYR